MFGLEGWLGREFLGLAGLSFFVEGDLGGGRDNGGAWSGGTVTGGGGEQDGWTGAAPGRLHFRLKHLKVYSFKDTVKDVGKGIQG